MVERLPQKYIPIHYDLFVHIIPEAHPFDAEVTITFKKNDDADFVVLYLQTNITIKNITQNKIPLGYNVEYPKLTIIKSQNPQILLGDQNIQSKLSIHYYQILLGDQDSLYIKATILQILNQMEPDDYYRVLMSHVFDHHLQLESKYQLN